MDSNTSICRTCLTKRQTKMKPIFKIINLLQKGASVHISHNDNLPKSICDKCYTKATKAYAFYCQCELSEQILKRTYSKLTNANLEIDDVFPSIDNELENKTPIYNPSECLYTDDNEFDEMDDDKTIIHTVGSDSQSASESYKMELDITTHALPYYSFPNSPISLTNHVSFKDALYNTVEESIKPDIESRLFEHEHTDETMKDEENHNFELVTKLPYDSQPLLETKLPDIIYNTPQTEIKGTISEQLKLSDNANKETVETIEPQTNVNKTQSYGCNICEKKYASKRNLSNHMRFHRRSDINLCQTCGKQFSLPENLMRHERIHTGKLPFVCPHCPNKYFAQSNQLKSHIITHTKMKPHLCSTCGNAYARASSLTVHIRRMHSVADGKRMHICSVCNKTFKDKRDLCQHMSIHRYERSFICATCGKAFNRKNNLIVHNLIHTGQRPYSCQRCPRAFRQKHVLETHLRTHST